MEIYSLTAFAPGNKPTNGRTDGQARLPGQGLLKLIPGLLFNEYTTVYENICRTLQMTL